MNIPDDDTIERISSHLEVMGNTTRLKLMYILSEEECGVLQLAELLNMSMPAVSHHIRLLKDKNMVIRRQEGKNVYYRLNDECLMQVLEVSRKHVEEHH